MKKTVLFRIFVLFLAFGVIFSALSVTSFAEEEKLYLSIGESVIYQGAAPDADSFATVYYKNGGEVGSEDDYNAKLEYDATAGFTLTLNGLEVTNLAGKYSIFAATDLNIVVLGENKILHTVNDNTDRYAIYVAGKLSVSGEGTLDVYMRGDCDFDALDIYAVRSHELLGDDKINAIDGRSEQEKLVDGLREEFDNKLSKTNYELALAKLNFANTAENLKFEAQRAKNIAIAAVVIGSVSLVVNGAIIVSLSMKKKEDDSDLIDDDEE